MNGRYTIVRMQGHHKEVYDNYFCRWMSFDMLDEKAMHEVNELFTKTSGLSLFENPENEVALP